MPLKKKSESAGEFKALKQRLENTEEFPLQVETHVSDHGGETIMSLDFQQFLADMTQGYT